MSIWAGLDGNFRILGFSIVFFKIGKAAMEGEVLGGLDNDIMNFRIRLRIGLFFNNRMNMAFDGAHVVDQLLHVLFGPRDLLVCPLPAQEGVVVHAAEGLFIPPAPLLPFPHGQSIQLHVQFPLFLHQLVHLPEQNLLSHLHFLPVEVSWHKCLVKF